MDSPESDFLEPIGQLVKSGREKKKLSQSEMAKKLKVGRSYLSQIESRRILPSEKITQKIAKILGEDPETYFDAIRKEKIIVKDRSIQDKVELFSLGYLLSQAQRSFKYRGFSGISFVLTTHENLAQSIKNGTATQLILARPTPQNLFNRVIEEEDLGTLRGDALLDHLRHRMDQQHLKLLNAFAYFKRVNLTRRGGIFDIRLETNYRNTSKRLVIIDDECCLLRPSRGKEANWFEFAVLEQGDEKFEDIQEEFQEIWEQSEPLDWAGEYDRYNRDFITKTVIQKLLEVNEYPTGQETTDRLAG